VASFFGMMWYVTAKMHKYASLITALTMSLKFVVLLPVCRVSLEDAFA